MSSPENAPFDDLLRRLNDGDEEAAAQLVHHYYDEIRVAVRWQLKRYPLLRRLKDSTDFTQDAFASAFRMFHEGCTFDTKEELIAFLKAIARNKVKKGAHQYLTAAKRDLRRQQSLDGAAPLADPAPGPFETAANDELVKQAIQSLNPLDRTILRMLFLERRSCREIAAALQYDEATIHRRLGLIIKKLPQLS